VNFSEWTTFLANVQTERMNYYKSSFLLKVRGAPWLPSRTRASWTSEDSLFISSWKSPWEAFFSRVGALLTLTPYLWVSPLLSCPFP
jgi:hypothetical protein